MDFEERWSYFKEARQRARELQSKIAAQEKVVAEAQLQLEELRAEWKRECSRRDALGKDLSSALIEEVKKN